MRKVNLFPLCLTFLVGAIVFQLAKMLQEYKMTDGDSLSSIFDFLGPGVIFMLLCALAASIVTIVIDLKTNKKD